MTVRDLVRDVAWRLSPGLMADRSVRWQFEHHPEPCEGWAVEAGPFAGLRYPRGLETIGAARLKREGGYEEALAARVAAALRQPPACFVDIGSAEGYYAVGVARAGVPTIAYESSSIQRRALRSLASANEVEVEVRGHCRQVPELPAGSLLMMDAEGAEAKLLTASTAQRLAASTVMVELHEMFAPGVTDALLGRFEATHSCEVIRGEGEPSRGEAGEWGIFTARAADRLRPR